MSIDKAIEALTYGARVWDALEALKEAKADRNLLAAEVTEWERLRDPAVLHAALLRGLPARLTPEQVWHLAADDRVRLGDLEAEVEALRAMLREARDTIDTLPGYPKGADLCDRIDAIDAAKAKESSNAG